METLTNWLISMAWPVVQRVLAALGLGVVTYESLSVLSGQLDGLIRGAWGGLGGAILDIASLGGIPQAIGIILAAYNARLAFLVLKKLSFLS